MADPLVTDPLVTAPLVAGRPGAGRPMVAGRGARTARRHTRRGPGRGTALSRYVAEAVGRMIPATGFRTAVPALGLGAALLVTGCMAATGERADPSLARSLPVTAPAPPRDSAVPVPPVASAGAGTRKGRRVGWPAPLPGEPGAAEPLALVVPRAGVNAPITWIGPTSEGVLEAPPLWRADLAGWDRSGPMPGEAGPAVIVGHLDTRTGPAVFARLPGLVRGDTVAVIRRDGSVVVFRVTSVERAPKAAFPVSRVYRARPYPTIRLVTCGGRYDRERHSYEENLIVYGDFAAWYRLSDFPRG
ncbi:class F sortase [Planomonospora sp. ID67723]|uniref:class F sortase n=1 Tax=Planomonospora sp. ID67723 TaxID=2738134 RepID=UPI0018C40377|nr:class F sortase [Planomonospora sp. ID67723]MBG0830703.1 class F sortase [Planomonospora sp. ID67723]